MIALELILPIIVLIGFYKLMRSCSNSDPRRARDC
jgi:hypothetical protein